MFSAFKARKPWAAALIGGLLGPVVGMLYLSLGRTAIMYGVVSIILMVMPFIAAHFSILTNNPIDIAPLTSWAVNAAGALHCFVKSKKSIQSPHRWYSRWYNIILIVVIIPLFIAFASRAFYEPFYVSSDSMQPTLAVGDYFYVNKLAYNAHDQPQRGDLILFQTSTSARKYIKRVIGMPGDRIQIKSGIIFINDKATLREAANTPSCQERDIACSIEILPEGKKIMILDKCPACDQENTIIYNVPQDSYFVLGDNRAQSLDSRFTDKFGYVKAVNIIGKPCPVWWNETTFRFSYRTLN